VKRYDDGTIYDLNPHEYIVVGTNYEGHHGAGAALYAMKNFGLQWGCGEGLSGQTYALPTMSGLEDMRLAAANFIQFATFNPDKTFYLTRVGCGIARHTDSEVAPLFKDAPGNVVKPEGWDYAEDRS
jgi:hypothetical protein